MNYRILTILFFFSFFHLTCKETPFFFPENEVDPLSPFFKAPTPIYFKINHETLRETSLEWGINRFDEDYVSGFILFRNYSENLPFELIQTIPANQIFTSYYFTDFFDLEKVTNQSDITYSLQSFYITESSDSLFSVPLFLSRIN